MMNKTKKTSIPRVAIVSSKKAKKTSIVVKKILANTTLKNVDNIDVESIAADELLKYNVLILGAPTWFDGELPNYWDELVPAIESLNFKGTMVAIFGNGDQKGYPENFGDAVGLLSDVFSNSGASIIGQTSLEGYTFEGSKAINNGMFNGLILDFENQVTQNDMRIMHWISSIEKTVLHK